MTASGFHPLRVGLVCPYAWDIPGGVQAHVRDLAATLVALGHTVSVLAPGDDSGLAADGTQRPNYFVGAGKAVPIPYNGSVARLQFGPVSTARVRRWLRQGQFDVVHIHEPAPPSLSLLTLILCDGPLVATFHAASTRSRILALSESVLQPFMEKLSARIAVSPAARKLIVEHLGADAVVIANGVDVARFDAAIPLPGYLRHGPTIGFIGRFDEPRKGMDVLVAALDMMVPERPDLRLLVAGRGNAADLAARLPHRLADRVEFLGTVSEADKASLLRSVDVYCAPNTGGESFGVILLEAMAARAAIVASDLEAFRQVLDAGDARAGVLFETGSPRALAAALGTVLDDASVREQIRATAGSTVLAYDWPTVVRRIVMVYELAIGAPVRGRAGV